MFNYYPFVGCTKAKILTSYHDNKNAAVLKSLGSEYVQLAHPMTPSIPLVTASANSANYTGTGKEQYNDVSHSPTAFNINLITFVRDTVQIRH